MTKALSSAGSIFVDLPNGNYIYELPLLNFGDIHGNAEISLVFNRAMENEGGDPFNIESGYKINLQKSLVCTNGAPSAYREWSGKITTLNNEGDCYLFEDDTQRTLRLMGATYEAEMQNYATETYDYAGKIVSVKDKYSATVWSYTYTSSKLTFLTYRGAKTVEFKYNNSTGKLQSISYGGKTVSFEYDNDILTVKHFNGVTYTLTCKSTTFTAESTNGYSVKAETIDDHTIKIYQQAGNQTDYVKYYFSNLLEYDSGIVEVEDKYGVITRMHFDERKLLYSYEVLPDNQMFKYDQFCGVVNVFNALNNDYDSAISKLGIHEGKLLTYSAHFNRWEYETNINNPQNVDGHYLLTGWIRSTSAYNPSNRVGVSNHPIGSVIVFYTNFSECEKWTFFAYTFKLDGTYIFVRPEDAVTELKDVRLTFVPTSVKLSNSNEYTALSKDILVCGQTEIPLKDAEFTCGTHNIASYGKVFYNDILRYKCNRVIIKNTDEFYYDKCKGVVKIGYNEKVYVKYNDAEYALDNCTLGRRSYNSLGDTTTLFETIESGTARQATIRVLDSNGNTKSSRTLNSKLDVIRIEEDDIITTYGRNNDLLTSEEVINFYKRQIAYTQPPSTASVTVTDEYGEKTVYLLDSVWGHVKSVTLPDGSVITDLYDNNCGCLQKRTFGSSDGRTVDFEYSKGNVSKVYQTNSLSYNFVYTNGDLTEASKNGGVIAEYSFTDYLSNGYYPSRTNASYTESVTTDKYRRPTNIDDNLAYTYDVFPRFTPDGTLTVYGDNADALLAVETDATTNETTRYEYNEQDLLISKKITKRTNQKSSETFSYDSGKRLTAHTLTASGLNIGDGVEYVKSAAEQSQDSRVAKYTYTIGNTQFQTANTYDGFKRLKTKAYNLSSNTITRNFVYNKMRISKITEKASSKTLCENTFGYDKLGRVSTSNYSTDKVTDNRKFTYDVCGQLVREDNQGIGKTLVYTYSDIGNLTSIKEYAYTTSSQHGGTYTEKTYTYNKDVLTNFNGKNIGYTQKGELLSYDGRSYSWSNGRLSRISQGASMQPGKYENLQFTYNAAGQRISKHYTYDTNTADLNAYRYTYNTNYTYDAFGRLIYEKCTETQNGVNSSRELTYLYDQGEIIGVIHKQGTTVQTYYYMRNIFGDVVGISDTSGNIKAEYIYDAYGNCTVTNNTLGTFAIYNPIRYRGHYLDRETGLYFLNTRYYNPEWRRFVSPDDVSYLDPESVNGLHLYVYCGNDPVNRFDPNGNDWKETWWGKALGWLATATLVVGAIAMIAVVAVGTVASGGLLGTVLVGAGVGILAGVGGSLAVQSGTGNVNPWSVATAGAIGGVIGAISGTMSWTFAQIGQGIGSSLGFVLSNARHTGSGVKIAKIFGVTTSMLMKAGSSAGGFAGGFIGGTLANYMSNEVITVTFGAKYSVDNPNYIRSGLLNLFKWLNALP